MAQYQPSFGYNMTGDMPGGSVAKNPPRLSLEDEMRAKSGTIEAEEKRRYEEGLGIAKGAYAKSEDALSKMIDPSLLFSRAADGIGQRGIQNMNALRSSLGARGINPNSGAANSALSRMAFDTGNAVTGATRDIEIENQRQRQVNAAVSFANALNLANQVNAPVSGVGLETTQNLFEGQLAREGMATQKKIAKNANKTDLFGGIFKGLTGLAGLAL